MIYQSCSLYKGIGRAEVRTRYLREPHSRSITRMLYIVIVANRTSVELV